MMRIDRTQYLNKLIRKKDNGRVKIITGIRRCGKSYLLFELYQINVTKDNSYYTISIPYDKGFKILVDNKKTKYQKSDNKIQEMQFKINNKQNLKEEKKTGIVIKDGKHKRNASNISSSEFEKNYIKNKIENFEKVIKNEDKKNNNMKNNKIDFKIINNNKPNYNEGNKINNYTPFNTAKKSQNNLKSSFITNYMKNSNEMQQKNIKNKNSLFQSQISITNEKTNYKINETYEKKKDNNIKYIHKNNSVILEENYEEKNPKKNKEKQNKKIKSKENEIIQKEEIEKNIKSKSQVKEKQPKNSEISNNLEISLKYNNKDKKELIEKVAQKKLDRKSVV